MYLFWSQKVYAINTCLVILASTLLKLSIVHIPISRVAWLKVAFVSPVKSLSVYVNLKCLVLMICPSKALSNLSFQQATPQVIPLHSRGGWFHRILSHYHQGCYDILSLCTLLFQDPLKRLFWVNDRVHQWSLQPNLFLGNFHVEPCLHKSWMSWLYLQCKGGDVTMSYAEIGASFQQ